MKNPQSGFSMVETIAVVVITGIIATMAVTKLSGMARMRKLDGEARLLLGEINRTHARVLKKDLACLIKFTPASRIYQVYEDVNANGVADAAELVISDTLGSGVVFGPAVSGPTVGPNATGSPAAKVEGAWAASMLLDRDRAATINTGSVYLSVTNVKAKTYCIRMSAGNRNLEIWRWDGSAWTAQ
jgi:prepilin-type N-terminal cleavage/methylation domain-containing protein